SRSSRPVQLSDLRAGNWWEGDLRASRPEAADAAADDRRPGLPPREGELRQPGRAGVVGRPDEEAAGVIRAIVRFLDQRTGTAPFLRKTLRYLFPDHWSFLLGEVALYAFIVLVARGISLTFFFVDSTHQVVYHGPYLPLRGQRMSEAYRS